MSTQTTNEQHISLIQTHFYGSPCEMHPHPDDTVYYVLSIIHSTVNKLNNGDFSFGAIRNT